MHTYKFHEFYNRSHDHTFQESELSEILLELPILIPGKIWLAGGALRRIFTHKPLDSDLDFFFATKEDYEKWSIDLELLANPPKQPGILIESPSLKIKNKFVNRNNETIICDLEVFDGNGNSRLILDLKIQLIVINYYNNPENLLDSFDFTLCQFATDGTDLFVGNHTLWDVARNRIALHKLTYPVASLRRLIKYTQQGYIACKGTLYQFLKTAIDDPTMLENTSEYID